MVRLQRFNKYVVLIRQTNGTIDLTMLDLGSKSERVMALRMGNSKQLKEKPSDDRIPNYNSN